jgi:hypothetical protein
MMKKKKKIPRNLEAEALYPQAVSPGIPFSR